MSNRPGAPATLPLATALDRSEPLTRLLQQLQASRENFAAIAELLPPDMRADVRPGPLQADGWTLLVGHGAAAAKLRQLLPLLLQRLQERGWQGTSIKVRVQPRVVPGKG